VIRALLGGSFDPIHAGHVAIVDRLLADALAAHVHVLPAARSPLKDRTTAPAAERLTMARLALGGRSHVTVDDREVRRGGASYTVVTLAELRAEHPADEWRLVLGSDSIADWDRWRQPERLLALATLLVVARGDWDGTLPPPLAAHAVIVRDFAHPASATEVRRRLAAGDLPRELLPAAVAEHILAARLYGLGERS
jgi:nicotinate-nucleotide adenylyltransferase